MSSLRFLVVSLGNTAPYHDTFHSAGHHVLDALRPLIPLQPPFSHTRRLGKKTASTSVGAQYTLAQSPSSMNISGRWVNSMWKDFVAEHGDPAGLGLVVVHDELENALGVTKRRPWVSSHRGHNGVKSIKNTLKKDYPGAVWERVSVGIGRPAERDAGTVADYVLSNMSPDQMAVVREKGAMGVLSALRAIEDEWLTQKEFAAQAKLLDQARESVRKDGES